MAAILYGKSVDTSMGMTPPIEGVMMGTRCGDLDVGGALFHIINKEDISSKIANTLVNKFSGVLGVSGVSSDMRDVKRRLMRVITGLRWLYRCMLIA